jgi:hypothetical protein
MILKLNLELIRVGYYLNKIIIMRISVDICKTWNHYLWYQHNYLRDSLIQKQSL